MLQVLTTLALLLPSSSRTLDSGPYCALGLFILCTILPRAPPTEVSCHVSNFAFSDTDSTIARGFVGLPTQGLI